ncbi:MAG: DUF3857 domain-containing protein [Bacteroidetes bacterium]|nr:DUF3857 domain-containing protein [Bacteroidota bacterium]
MKRTLVFIALLVSVSVFAQKPTVKYGNVSKADLLLEKCSFEEDAEAMVLARSGELEFVYDNNKGWQYTMDVVVRMKIFSKEGMNVGNVKIQLYDPDAGGYQESVNGLKAVTYNLENGKIVKSKLPGGDKFLNRINNWYTEYSFAMPNLKEGSVFEYRYTLISDYISNLTEWFFQEEIPVQYNEFTYVIPEYFNYRSMIKGTVLPMEHMEERANQTFSIVSEKVQAGARTSTAEGGIRSSTKVINEYTLDARCTSTKYIAKNVPSVIEEPFGSNYVDVPARIEFQLMSVHYPNTAEKTIATNYDDFTDKLLKRDDFGLRLTNAPYASDLVNKTIGKDEMTKAEIILNGIKKQIKWNGDYGIFSRKAGRMAYNKREGEIADLNLTLVGVYREVGLESYPVILSTRGHGHVHPAYPSTQDFNYVIAAVIVEGEIILCDASADFGLGYLPSRCFNGQGWVVDREKGQWVDLKANNTAKTSAMMQLVIKDNMVNGICNVKSEVYSARNMMNQLKDDGEETFINDIKDVFVDYEVKNVTWGEENSDSEFRYSFNISAPLDDAEIIYIQPFSDIALLENPFKREERFSPVDIKYNYSDKAVTIIEVPEGYVAELPEQVRFKLPDGGLAFNYQVLQRGNKLTLISHFKIKRSDYTPEEYVDVKNFFEEMVKMNNQMVVLKRS